MRVARWSSWNSSSSTSGWRSRCSRSEISPSWRLSSDWLRRARLTSSSDTASLLLGLGGGHRGDSATLRCCSTLGVLPEDDHADAGGQHRHAVDDRPASTAGCWPAWWLNMSVGRDGAAEPVRQHREHDVPEERHPVLVERDEADEDEEVEVGLDRAAGQVHQHRRAVHEAGGDEEGGDAAVPRHAGEHQAGQRHRHLERRVARRRSPATTPKANSAGTCRPRIQHSSRCRRRNVSSSSVLPRGR